MKSLAICVIGTRLPEDVSAVVQGLDAATWDAEPNTTSESRPSLFQQVHEQARQYLSKQGERIRLEMHGFETLAAFSSALQASIHLSKQCAGVGL